MVWHRLVLGSSLAVPVLFAAPGSRASAEPRLSALPASPAPRLVYHGGRVISNVKVHAVNWGPNVWSKVVSTVPGFFDAIAQSAYIDWLGAQYDTAGRVSVDDGMTTSNQHIGRGSFGTSTTITPSVSGNQIDDVQIEQELGHQLDSGALPRPDVDAAGNVNALYYFFFPPGTSISFGSSPSCQTWGAYHYSISYHGKIVPFVVIPDYSQDCGEQDWTTAQVSMSHELVEAITDTEPYTAWYSGDGEIGDLCLHYANRDAGAGRIGTIADYTVQFEWSNEDNACVLSSSYGALPVCAPPLRAPSCRPCTPADEGKSCTGGTPHCDSSPTSANRGECVGCTTHAECASSTPVCDASGRCVQCSVDADCTDPSNPTCTNHACGPCVGRSCADAGSGDGSGGSQNSSGGSGGDNASNGAAGDASSAGCGCRVESRERDAAGGLSLTAALALAARRRLLRAARR